MRAIEITQPGPPECPAAVRTARCPTLKAGEVLIKVHAAGINRPDVLQRLGHYPVPPGASDLPGLEVAGEIVDGDLDGSGFKKGDMVCALVQGGGYAEYCAAPVAAVPAGPGRPDAARSGRRCRKPSSPSGAMCSTAPAWPTAKRCWCRAARSGIGVTAIQLAAALGHRVFATAGSDDKCRACEELGAERGINYRTEDFVEVVKELTGGKGVDVILDMVAGDYVAREIDCLADDGRIALIALLGGAKATVDLGQVLRRRLTHQRLDPAPAPGRVQGRDRRAACARRCGR